MVNRELIEVFSEIAREKNVERSELATILEELFLYVIEKEYGDSSNCSCIVNLDKGEIEIYAEKTIVEEIDDYKVEITLEEAIEKEPDASDLEVGDVLLFIKCNEMVFILTLSKLNYECPNLNRFTWNDTEEERLYVQ